jgi:hypothetical protein
LNRTESRSQVCATDDPHGQTILATVSQGKVLACEFLIFNLLLCLWVITTVASVDELVALTNIILIATRDDD